MKEMDYKYIEQLLGRYWNCETSIEEEQILRSFFSQDDIPEELREYAPLFTLQNEEQQVALGNEFDEKMLDLIAETEEVTAKKKASVLHLVARQVYPFIKAVAVVAVILTIGNVAEKATMTQEQFPDQPSNADTYVRQENISAQIKVIDQKKSEVSMAKADSLTNSAPVNTPSQNPPMTEEKIR